MLHDAGDRSGLLGSMVLCDGCEYARFHDRCGLNDSGWRCIMDVKEELRRMIDNHYYGGEKYG